MAFYHYYCEANDQTVEVRHAISERLKTWGEVCEKAGHDPGKTPLKASVIRLIGRPMPVVWRVKGLDKDAPSGHLNV